LIEKELKPIRDQAKKEKELQEFKNKNKNKKSDYDSILENRIMSNLLIHLLVPLDNSLFDINTQV
jgi:hypothetical protein